MLVVRWILAGLALLVAATCAAFFAHVPAGLLLLAASPLVAVVLYLVAVVLRPPRQLPPL